jgi:hypothetical protein
MTQSHLPRFVIPVEAEEHARIKKACRAAGITIRQLVLSLLRDWSKEVPRRGTR